MLKNTSRLLLLWISSFLKTALFSWKNEKPCKNILHQFIENSLYFVVIIWFHTFKIRILKVAISNCMHSHYFWLYYLLTATVRSALLCWRAMVLSTAFKNMSRTKLTLWKHRKIFWSLVSSNNPDIVLLGVSKTVLVCFSNLFSYADMLRRKQYLN